MNERRILWSFVYWSAVALSSFNAVSAVAGGIGILASDGLGMPASFLASGPFTDFTVPGLILLIVVGGSQAVSAWLLIVKSEAALLWTAVAGSALIIWIFVETALISSISWLQVLYFVTGGAQIIAVYALLGIVSWLPRRPMRR